MQKFEDAADAGGLTGEGGRGIEALLSIQHIYLVRISPFQYIKLLMIRPFFLSAF